MSKIVWVCSCGIYWIWSEENARKHEKKAKHSISKIELSNEQFTELKLSIISNRIKHNKKAPFPFTELLH